MAVATTACNNEPPASEGLGLAVSKEEATIDITKQNTLQLTASVQAQGNYVYSWSSDNREVATVNASGLVTAVAAGTANITVSVRERGTTNTLESKTCRVSVVTPEGYYTVITGTSGVAQNDIVKANPGKWYFYYGSSLNGTVYSVKDDLNMDLEGLKGTWYLRYYPAFTAGTMLDISFTVTLDAEAYLRVSAGGKIANGGVEYHWMEAGTHQITAQRVLGDIPFSVSLTTAIGVDSATAVNDTFYAGDLNMKITDLSFTEGVKLTDASDNVVSKATINLAKQQTNLQLYATPPANAPEIEWSSSEKSVATVDENGLVTGLSAGKTVITAKSGLKSASCVVTVIEREVVVNKPYVILDLSGNKTVNLKLSSSDGSEVNAVWASSDTGVATVENGVVTAVAAGSAVIKAEVDGMDIESLIAVGDSAYTQRYALANGGSDDALGNPGKWFTSVTHSGLKTVEYAENAIAITQDANERTVNFLYQPLFAVGSKYSVSFTVEAASGSLGTKATKLQFGTGTGYGAGTDINSEYETQITNATSLTCTGEFTVSADNPFFITFKIQKTNYSVKNITFTLVEDAKAVLSGISNETLNLKADGDESERYATIEPVITGVDDDDLVLTWSSDNEAAATVDQLGKVTAVAAGVANIKVTDGVNEFTCVVSVAEGQSVPDIFLVSVSPVSATLDKANGGEYPDTLTLNVTLSGEGECELQYSTDNENVATVDEYGNITALAAGTAVITVTDGEVVKTCTITVINSNAAKLTGISSTGLIMDLSGVKTPKTAKLEAQITGEGVENVTTTWSSDNESVATVDENGNVTAVAAGTTYVTVSDGTNEKICKVVVSDSANIRTEYSAALDKTADDVLANPGVWYSVGSHADLTDMAVSDGGIVLTKSGSNARTLHFMFQPFMQVGTKYTVSFTLSYSSGSGWGSTTENFYYGTGTGASGSGVVSEDGKIVTEHATALKGTATSHTFTGTFTVEESNPFFISIKTSKGAFSITDITFTPVAE